MAEISTRADSLRFYLSGAPSDGGVQTDVNQSLGNFRSSTEEVFKSFQESGGLTNIQVDYIGGANEVGNATLVAVDSGSVAFKSSGGFQGLPTGISNGESKVVEDGINPAKFIRVTRTSASALSGTKTMTMRNRFGNVTGLDNISLSEAAIGEDEYRALFVINVSVNSVDNIKLWMKTLGATLISDSQWLGETGAGTISLSIGNFNAWPTRGFVRIEDSLKVLKEVVYYSSRTTQVLTIPEAGRGLFDTTPVAGTSIDFIHPIPGNRFGIETPSANAIQTIPNENTAPGGVSFSLEISEPNSISIGTLTPSQTMGIWIHRLTVPGQVADSLLLNVFNLAFEAV